MSENLIPEGYKQTEIGVIPEGWSVVELGDAVFFLDGQRRPIKSGDRAKIKGQYPYYGASGIVDYVNDYIFDGEFILLGEDGENILSRSLPLAFKVKGRVWVNNHAHVLQPREEFNIDFLTNFLESLDYSLLNSGTAQPKLNKKSCFGIKVLKPNIKEQTAIANALSDVDGLLGGLEKLIAKKQAIKTATMQQLLTGKTRLPQFAHHPDGTKKAQKQTELGPIPEDWEAVQLGTITKINMGQSPSSQFYNNKGVGLPLVQGNADISNRETIIRNYTSQITKTANKGDLILSVRAPVGEVAKATFDCCIGRGVCAINYENNYIYQWLISFESEWDKFSKGSTFDSINSDELRVIQLAIPQEKEEQTAIAQILSDMDSEIQTLQTRLTKTQQIKQGMMQQLLTGKVRLV